MLILSLSMGVFLAGMKSQTPILSKHLALIGYPMLAVIIGSIYKLYELKKERKLTWRQCLLNAIRAGILCGALAFTYLAVIIAIIREMVTDIGIIGYSSYIFIFIWFL